MRIAPTGFPHGKSTRKIEPQAPRAANAAPTVGSCPERTSVSPVSSKKKVLKCEPGRNWPFSGRLNGVAPAVLASAFASKLAAAHDAASTYGPEVWTLTQSAGHEVCNCLSI